MYSHILLPTNGELERERNAIDTACGLAEALDATLHVAHVIDEDLEGLSDDYQEEIREKQIEQGEQALTMVSKRIEETGVTATTELREHPEAYEALLDIAKKENVDLIVIAKRSQIGLGDYLMGSTTNRVLKSGEIPVLTVPASAGNPS